MPPRRSRRRIKVTRLRQRARLELDHLYLPTSNFKEAWRYWTEILGFTAERTWGEGSHKAGQVKAGKTKFVIANVDNGTTEEFGYTTQHGKPEIFIATSQIDQQYEFTKSQGGKIVREPFTTHWGPRAFSVEGPDLMVVTFIETSR